MINPSIPNRTDNDDPNSSSTGYSRTGVDIDFIDFITIIVLAPIVTAITLTIGASFVICFVICFLQLLPSTAISSTPLPEYNISLWNFDNGNTTITLAFLITTSTLSIVAISFIIYWIVSIKSNYKYLKEGQIIEEGDEQYDQLSHSWDKCCDNIGRKVYLGERHYIRRLKRRK